MKWAWMLAVGAIAAGAPGPLLGQGVTRPPAQWGFPPGEHHGRLGVLVNTEADPATDSVGAHVEAVTPGGPAAKAGLKAGDVITKFQGKALGGVSADEEGGGSGPGRRLVELARVLQPGDTIQVEYRRGNDRRKTTLVAADVSVWSGIGRVDLPRGPNRISLLPGPEGGFSFCLGDAWCDMELVTLTPDLGEYFGTREGILVVKAPADSSLPLKSGDVILAIGGRKPTSVSHAMRILRSYEANETVALDVMRKQKRITVTWQVPRSDVHPFMHPPRMRSDSDGDSPQG
jgi:predicted metalloprotease with PDZ domain